MMRLPCSGTAIAAAVRTRKICAREIVLTTLESIKLHDKKLNGFTTILSTEALNDAGRVDQAIENGIDPGPLAGVPFAVKNLYDVAGFPTLAGARITRKSPPAQRDAVAIRRLRSAGAILVGMLNMDEFAFGWTTENSHYGNTRNPHDHDRTPGGSSGGAGAAVGAGLVPIALGSDTNGSVRVPAAFCGVFGLKPTYGLLSRDGMALLAQSLDHVGVLATSVHDLAAAFDVLRLHFSSFGDLSSNAGREYALAGDSVDSLRMAVVAEEFGEAIPEAWSAVETVANALGVTRRVRLREVHRARAAASLITACEAASAHLPALQHKANDLDPLIRDRLLAAALLPATTYVQAQTFQAWFRANLLAVFRDIDLLITPTAPCFPPVVGPGGVDIDTKLSIGRFTQPFSLAGFPALSVPLVAAPLPLGVQLIARPFQEEVLLRLAAHLERAGVISRWPRPADAS